MILLFNALVAAQAQEPSSRAETIEKERDRKTAVLKPETLSRAEQALRDIQDKKLLERFSYGYNGLRAAIGNMATGSGFALGPEFHREDLLRGHLTTRITALVSTRRWQKYESEVTLPRLANGQLTLGFHALHRNYSSVDYYGPGPDSGKGGRSTYRFEDTRVNAGGGWRPVRLVRLAARSGYVWTNVGPGDRKGAISTDRLFNERTLPGIERQTNFAENSASFQVDWRDDPAGPKTGGNYVIQQTWYSDRVFGRYSFGRLDLDLQQYVGFFNKTRRFAFRAKAALTDAGNGQTVPFYMQPTIGGADDLRGFRPYRFSGPNAMSLTGEYRWEIFSGMDGALFADAGKVFPRRGQLNFSNLESSVGFGLRANARNRTFLRIDVGFSHEGFAVFVKFNDVFQPRPFGVSQIPLGY